MFLRTTKRRNHDGSTVHYLQLAESEWDPQRGHAVARILHSFGRIDRLDTQQMRRLAKSLLRTFPALEDGGEADVDVPGATGAPRLIACGSYGPSYAVQQLACALSLGPLIGGRGEDALVLLAVHRVLQPALGLPLRWPPEELLLPGACRIPPARFIEVLEVLGSRHREFEQGVAQRGKELIGEGRGDPLFHHHATITLAAVGERPAQATVSLTMDERGLPLRSRAQVTSPPLSDLPFPVTLPSRQPLSEAEVATARAQAVRFALALRTQKECLDLPVPGADRVQAHTTITMLALLLEAIAEHRSGLPFSSVVRELSQIKAAEIEWAGGRVHQTTAASEEAASILAQLGLPLPPEQILLDTRSAPPASGAAAPPYQAGRAGDAAGQDQEAEPRHAEQQRGQSPEAQRGAQVISHPAEAL